MKGGKTIRVALDVALTVMIVLEMFIQFTGEFLHEVIGFAFFATVVLHVALSAAWVRKTARNAKEGKLTARRTALSVVGCLLALTVIVLGVSSIAISGILASAGFVWPVGSYAMWASVHTASAYLLCGLVVVHLAMHWAFLALAFKVPYNPSRRHAITTSVNAVAALGVLALGVTAVGKVAPSASGAAVEESTESQAWAAGPAGDITGESSTSGSSSSAASTPAAPSSGKPHGKNSSSSMSGSSSSASSSGQSATSSTSGQAQAGSASGTESSSAGSTSGSSSSASGICTLCRKQCPLSAPKCNKPYEAGLL